MHGLRHLRPIHSVSQLGLGLGFVSAPLNELGCVVRPTYSVTAVWGPGEKQLIRKIRSHIFSFLSRHQCRYSGLD